MFNSKKIDRLTVFIIKALQKSINAGNKIIETYQNTEPKIQKLKIIIVTLEDALAKLQKISEDKQPEG
jgi:hypothetical protein